MKILVVGPSWVGDSVISQSLLKVISSKFKEVVVDVLSPGWTIDVFKRMAEVSETILLPFAHGDIKIKGRVEFGHNLRNRNYDQAIVLPNSLKSSLIPFFANIPLRTGWKGEMRYFLLNDIRKLNKLNYPRMVDRFVSLALKEDEEILTQIPYPKLTVDKNNLINLSNSFRFQLDLPTIALCPGAEFGPSKKWPAIYFAEVANFYLTKGWQVFLLGSTNDETTGYEIEENITNKGATIFNLIGKTKIQDTIDTLSFCRLVLTNDSGLMHVAASVDVNLIVLYGPTSPLFTPPLSSKALVIKKNEDYSKIRYGDLEDGYHQSLQDIKPEEVLDALLEFGP